MHMCFDVHTIKGKIYKKLIQDLCQVSDNIFFTSDREYTVDEEGVQGVEGECERVDVPSDERVAHLYNQMHQITCIETDEESIIRDFRHYH